MEFFFPIYFSHMCFCVCFLIFELVKALGGWPSINNHFFFFVAVGGGEGVYSPSSTPLPASNHSLYGVDIWGFLISIIHFVRSNWTRLTTYKKSSPDHNNTGDLYEPHLRCARGAYKDTRRKNNIKKKKSEEKKENNQDCVCVCFD